MIFLGADEKAFDLKEAIKAWLKEWGHEFKDMGAHKKIKGDDFPDYAFPVARQVAASQGGLGILSCGTGVGMDIAANKVEGIRAGLAINPEQVKWAKRADHVNVLVLAAEFVSKQEAKKMVKTFLETSYGKEERYQRRLNKVKTMGDCHA